MSRLGSKIRDARTAKGLSLKQLGKLLGVTESFVLDMETGKKVISDILLTRVSKILEIELQDSMLAESDKQELVPVAATHVAKPVKKEVQPQWTDAFDSILKSIPIYDYSLSNVLGMKQLPVISNKIDGYNKDKVLYIEIQNNDMLGFRILQGDLALLHQVHEVENNTICLMERRGERIIRQIRKLEGDKLLLLSNPGTIVTETVFLREIKILGRLVRLEIKL